MKTLAIFNMMKLIWSFSVFKQVNSEKERVVLITRATVAEAQVLELQDYIDNHLGRSADHVVCKSYHG